MSDSSNGPVYIDDSILGFSFNPNIVTPSTISQPSRDAYTYVNETLPDVFNHTYTAMTAWGWQLDWPFVGLCMFSLASCNDMTHRPMCHLQETTCRSSG